jgi:hypothetical protein
MLKYKNYSYFATIFIVSLSVRLIYGYYSWYIRDQARIFDLGFSIFKYHNIPIHGSPVVYSDSLLPGSLQGILASIPLFISNGNPYSIIVFVQVLNLIACVIIAKTYSNIFEKIDKKFIFAFILLNPMNIIFSYAWNPSFMIIFTSLFFLGLQKVFKNKNDQFGLFLIYFPHLLLLQLNLQFLILSVLLVVLIIKRIISFPSIKILSISIMPGIVTLTPYVLDKVFLSSIGNNSWNLKGNIFENIQFHPENLISFFHVTARFLSFSTGEVSRNLGHGFIASTPLIWPFFIIGMLGSIFIFIFSILFYLSKNHWLVILKSENKLDIFQKMDFFLLLLPIITTLLFLFSITPPTTHKIWSLFPFCFYPFFRSINYLTNENNIEFPIFFQKIKRIVEIKYFKNIFVFFRYNIKKIITLYITSTLLYSCFGGSLISTNYAYIIKNSKIFCSETPRDKIQNIIKNEYDVNREEEYTFSLLCEYWESQK